MANRTEFQSGTFNRILKTSTEAGKLIAVKGCFKLGTALKKAAVKNRAAKKTAAAKKPSVVTWRTLPLLT
jgi:hypothetical protein